MILTNLPSFDSHNWKMLPKLKSGKEIELIEKESITLTSEVCVGGGYKRGLLETRE